MKVYVNEMPKCCAECRFCYFKHNVGHCLALLDMPKKVYEIGEHCPYLARTMSCPLQLLPKDEKWEKLKEWLKAEISDCEVLIDSYCNEIEQAFINIAYKRLRSVIEKMTELEGDSDE